MGIQQRPDTGEHFISAPKVRASRQRYEKTPLLMGRSRFVEAILSLFRRTPRPFISSAMADRIDRGLRVTKQVLQSRDPVSIASGSTMNVGISGQLHEFSTVALVRADAACDAIDEQIHQEELWLDECRPESILTSLKTDLHKTKVELSTRLLPLARDLVGARVSLEGFRQRNDISDDLPYGKPLDLAVIGQVGVLLLVEFVANVFFQADTSQRGLLGGATIAIFYSLATIVLGVTFGIAVQQSHKSAKAGGWIGVTLMLLAFIGSFFFVSAASLIRVAGEGGNEHPIEAARAQLAGDPVAGVRAMLDLPAFAYTICIIALIYLVARKYLDYAGSFPGLRQRALAYEDAEAEFDFAYDESIEQAQALLEEQNEYLDSTPGFIASCKVPIRTLVADHENVLDQFRHDEGDVRTAARLFDAFVAEHGEAGGATSVLAPATNDYLNEKRDWLESRHSKVMATADRLCGRDDVADATVEMVRERFEEEMEQAFATLADCKQAALDTALAAHRKDRSWLSSALAPETVAAVAIA